MSTKPNISKIELLKKYLRIEFILIFLAVIGLAGGIVMVVKDREKPPVGQPVSLPAVAPFEKYISGTGIVEADGSNVNIGSFQSGIIKEIFVNVGDFVEQGKPLFVLDQRQALQNISVKQALLESAQANYDQAKTAVENAKHLRALVQGVQKQAISKEEIIKRRDNVALAQANLKIAEANIAVAQAELAASQTDLELLTVLAPMDGEVLQVNINQGEFVTASTQTDQTTTPAPILFGNVRRFQIRVQIDETDAWKFKPGSPAFAYLRGDATQKIPITYHYTEPYVVPKTELTGSPQERVDTRVLQVVYTYNPKNFSSYVGQQLDVYIEAVQ